MTIVRTKTNRFTGEKKIVLKKRTIEDRNLKTKSADALYEEKINTEKIECKAKEELHKRFSEKDLEVIRSIGKLEIGEKKRKKKPVLVSVEETVPLPEPVLDISKEEVEEDIPTIDAVHSVVADGIDIDELPPYQIYEPDSYKDGPEGFIRWVEENVSIPIYPEGNDIAVWTPVKDLPKALNPETGRSYWSFWNSQKPIFRQALRMVDMRFIYKLIILCWPRGDGKSLIACLIQLWKFFNWPRQQIVLGANSKDQIKFVHYDIMVEIIQNSPPLLKIIGKKNILEKVIRLRDSKGNISSVIRAISSFSGIVSNITGYTFSEMFDMKNPKFFVQLDGSMRNVPNALGVIDSTVSTKTHILYSLFTSFVKKESKTLYFSYRYSRNADYKDYWSPNMTQRQLDDYKIKFPLGDFERYFQNTWGSVADKIFTEEMVDVMLYVGFNNRIGNFEEINKAITTRSKTKEQMEMLTMETHGTFADGDRLVVERSVIEDIDKKLISVEKYYRLTDGFSSCLTPVNDLESMSELFDTDWAIMCGYDRADPMKGSKHGARTIFVCVAKGLPGSRSHYRPFDEQGIAPNYFYLVLHLVNVESHSTEDLKAAIKGCHQEYDGLDAVCAERWASWDIDPWAKDEDIPLEIIFPTYDKQKSAFSDLFLAVSKGRLKSPTVYVTGSKEEDILREEMKIFYHDPDKHWFGSPEKNEKYGIQDDVMFSLAWTIYGGRSLTVDSFRKRRGNTWFGSMMENKQLLGKW